MSEKQLEALRLVDALDKKPLYYGHGERSDMPEAAADTIRRQHALLEEIAGAMRMAVTQNSLDMLMTGEEIRQCEAVLAKLEASK